MSPLERYRKLYEHEIDCNVKMLTMIESVPVVRRSDARFQQAVNIAAHLAACRENFVDMMAKDGRNQVEWFEKHYDPASLKSRFTALERLWTDYLAELDDSRLGGQFPIPISESSSINVPVEEQILQLVGHASYHRGQVALLVDQLGGETVDTDYIDWVMSDAA